MAERDPSEQIERSTLGTGLAVSQPIVLQLITDSGPDYKSLTLHFSDRQGA